MLMTSRNHHLIPECIKLDTNCFWKTKNAIKSGSITMTVPAVTIPHWAPVSNDWANRANPTVNGRFSTESVMINGHIKLLQCVLMETSANAIYVGLAVGMYTFHNVWYHLLPSILDDSSSSYGTCLNVCLNRNTPKADAQYGIMTASFVSTRPKSLMT